ncbi:hypothetical protein PIB30_062517 [Stylosanthes scabra]|uniref:Reverse transcriptase Ty1/copia-type domain-containing protein n=1 Tax=Stylosanthes scabra TaxID=79078 RepID=A0ABU6ZJZ1_9FABA|nr:hypothetical protein [Stylosanthes scabra]
MGITASSVLYVLVYVDDIIIPGSSNNEIDDVTQLEDGGLLLSQEKYAKDLLAKVADVFTKALPSSSFLDFRFGLSVVAIPSKSDGNTRLSSEKKQQECHTYHELSEEVCHMKHDCGFTSDFRKQDA